MRRTTTAVAGYQCHKKWIRLSWLTLFCCLWMQYSNGFVPSLLSRPRSFARHDTASLTVRRAARTTTIPVKQEENDQQDDGDEDEGKDPIFVYQQLDDDRHALPKTIIGKNKKKTRSSSFSSSSPTSTFPQYHHPPLMQQQQQQKRDWLEQATSRLLELPSGSLVTGQWHQLTSMISAWGSFAKRTTDDPYLPASRMEALVKRLLEEKAAQNDNPDIVVTADLYHRILEAWARAALFDLTTSASSLKTTNSYHQNTTTTSAIRSPHAASQRAREILVFLQETYDATLDETLLPQRESFQMVLRVVGKVEGALIARRILAWMEYLTKNNKNPHARPHRSDYVFLLDAYASNGPDDPNAGVLAEAFLRHMHSVGVQPDTFCYNIAIRAWNKARRGREAAEHADRILEEMNHKLDCAPPDEVTYVSVISAWAASGMRAHAVTRVEELLQEYQERLSPTTVVYNAIMSAWVKSRSPEAVPRTQELLRQMEEASSSAENSNSEDGPVNDSIRPDLITYNTHLHALSMHSLKHPEYALRAQQLLDKMEAAYDVGRLEFGPNLFSYNLVIDAYCRSNQALRAAEVLRRLVKREDVEPDTFSFNQVLSVLSRNTHSFKGAVRMAEQLLQYMIDSYQSGLHPYARPDAVSYACVLFAHSKSGEQGAPERAEALLESMKDRYRAGEQQLKPNRICYNALIDCWAKAGEGTRGARKAEALLDEMQAQAHDDEDMAPNIVSYNSVLNAWARSGTRCCGIKAEFYLNRMWELYQGGNELVKPNDLSYNTVINAISKSKNEGKAQKALRILRRMDKLYRAGNKEARPNEITYTAVLNSCAFPAALDEQTRRKALHTAIFTLEELQSSRYGQPNQVTYGTFIKACANLLPENDALRRKIIQKAFEQCCKDGQCGEMVLNYLRKAAPSDLYEELFADFIRSGTRLVAVEDLPPEWRCNVRDKDSWRDRPARRKAEQPRRNSSTQRKTSNKQATLKPTQIRHKFKDARA